MEFFIIGLFYACTDIPATNPYDSKTPASQQAKSVIKGTITLPSGDENTEVFRTAKVLLFPTTIVLPDNQICRPENQEEAQFSTDLGVNDQRKGTFQLNDVIADQYLLTICVSGYIPVRQFITLEQGKDVTFNITLSAIDVATVDSGIVGLINLEGANAEGHGDILVETINQNFAVVSTSQGQYHLKVPPGTYDIKFTKKGYISEIRPNIVVALDEIVRVEEITLPKDLSGSLNAQLRSSISNFDWPNRATVKLMRAENDSDDSERIAIPTDDGSFSFDLLQPGIYLLQVKADGHLDLTLPRAINHGPTVLNEPIVLTASSDELINGYAYLDDQQSLATGNHLGILVQAFIDDTLVGTTQTDEEGRYSLTAGRSDYQLRFTRQGYDSKDLSIIWSFECGRSNCFETANQESGPLDEYTNLILSGKPSRVSGMINLSPFETPQRLQAVDIDIYKMGDLSAILTTHPNSNGYFAIADLSAGEYTLKINALGYEEFTREISLSVDDHLELGTINLAHLSTLEEAAIFSGIVRLNDSDNHANTTIQVIFSQTGQILGRTQTDSSGQFNVRVSPNETYRVLISRDGYQSIDSEQIGTFTFQDGQFLNEVGESLNLILDRIPLNGRLTIPVTILPDWLPLEQKYVRITVQQLNGSYRRIIDGVTELTPASFENLPEGNYVVTCSRLGFDSEPWIVTLSSLNQEAQPESPLLVRLVNLSLAEIDLDGRSLNACQLRQAASDLNNFTNMYRGADFSGSYLGGQFGLVTPEECVGCDTTQSCGPFDLTDANFTNTSFTNLDGDLADFSSVEGGRVSLSRAQLFGAEMSGVNFGGASLTHANLFGANAAGANFARTDLTRTNMTSTNLEGAFFAETDGTYPNLLVTGTDAAGNPQTTTHPWAGLYIPIDSLPSDPCGENHGTTAATLNGTNFAQANLTNAFMAGTQLSEATLADARITSTDLRGSCLRNASLNLIDLSYATLDHADLTNAHLTNAILSKSNLRGVLMNNASLASAVIEQANFGIRQPINEEDHCHVILPWCEYEEAGCEGNEVPGRCFNQEGAPSQCRCRSQLQNVNFNGANLVGSTFSDIDLKGSTLLGISVGDTTQRPRVQPIDCQPQYTDACLDFLDLLFESQITDEQEQEVLKRLCITSSPEEEILYSFNSRTAYCVISYMQYLGLSDLSSETEVVACLISPEYVDTLNLPAPTQKCTFENIQATWELEEAGLECEQDENTTIWDCCPSYRIGQECSKAKTSFSNSRLSNVQMNGVGLTKIVAQNVVADDAVFRNISIDSSNLSFQDLYRTDLSFGEFSQTNFSGSSIQQTNLRHSFFSNSSLANTNLTGSDLSDAYLINTDLNNSYIDEEGTLTAIRITILANQLELINDDVQSNAKNVYQNVSWPGASLGGSRIENVIFNNPNFEGISMTGANLASVGFTTTPSSPESMGKLNNADFTGTIFQEVRFKGMDGQVLNLDNTIFRSSHFSSRVQLAGVNQDMARGNSFGNVIGTNADFSSAIFLTTFFGGQWFSSNFESARFMSSTQIYSEFTSCNFDWSTFASNGIEAIFIDSDFVGARFIDAYCSDCEFRGSDLHQSSFKRVHGTWKFTEGTELWSSKFLWDGVCGSKLENTSFSGLNLNGADLTGICNLEEINLDNAQIYGTKICSQHADLLGNTEGDPILEPCPQLPICPDPYSVHCPID